MVQNGETQPDAADPKGLIREAYLIEGIGAAECRSIFLDWALSLGPGSEPAACAAVLLGRYGTTAPGHPMTEVLRGGTAPLPPPARRGGAGGRRRD